MTQSNPTTKRKYQRAPITNRFWKFVDPSPAGCWEWRGGLSNDGYGQIFRPTQEGEKPTKAYGRTVFAHRVSWEIHRGTIPKGLCVLHKCDNPPCVNPDHLFLGTHQENMKDKAAKGRSNVCVKLTSAQVQEIRGLYRPYIVTFKMLGALYGVDASTIGKALKTR